MSVDVPHDRMGRARRRRSSASLDWLRTQLDGEFGVQSRSDDDSKWIVSATTRWPRRPRAYLYDRAAQTLTELYTSRPELEGAPLQPMQPLEIPSRDGLTLVELPDPAAAAATPTATACRTRRCRWCCWSTAARGRATATASTARTSGWPTAATRCSAVNFRGSTGFGKAVHQRRQPASGARRCTTT